MKNGESEVTTNHEIIRKWATERGGHPAYVPATNKQDEPGLLCVDFDDSAKPGFQRITWDEFFDRFETDKLAFLYQDVTSSGKVSRFSKFVRR